MGVILRVLLEGRGRGLAGDAELYHIMWDQRGSISRIASGRTGGGCE